jgi:2-haloacid dehalogenase
MTRRRVLVFDVNETLLDVEALAPHFARVFGHAAVVREWFATVLHYSNVVSLAGAYSDFSKIGGAAHDMVAAFRHLPLAADDRAAMLQTMRSLPPHSDASPALERRRDSGFRMVALTNSAPAAARQQLEQAQLIELFERWFSADEVKRYKPAPEPYQHVARQLGVPIRDLRMIAAHAWDVMGALQAGCVAAFIARPGKVLFPLGPQPDIVAPDLQAAAERILVRD